MTPRVLIVEDEALVRRGLKAFLEDEHFQVETVGSAEQGLEVIEEDDSFDICIMDIRLPGMSGHEALKIYSKVRPRLRFIIHTGSIDYVSPPPDLKEPKNVLAVLHKPLADLTVLTDLIRSALAEAGEGAEDPSDDPT